MKKSLNEYVGNGKKQMIFAWILSLAMAILFFATYPLHLEIVSDSSIILFVCLNILSLVPLILCLLNLLVFRNRALDVAIIIVAAVEIVAFAIFLAYVLSKLYYLVVEAGPYILIAAELALILILAFLPRFKRQKAARICTICALSAVFVLTSLFCVFDFRPLYFNSGAVVFAVEDEYQIAFSTSATGVAYVQIGDNKFYDAHAGANKASTVHKISVPRKLLEEERTYSVCCTQVFHTHAFFSPSGRTITKTYEFRPANYDDGLQIFNFSDNHLLQSGVKKAARYFGDRLDLIIANGDLINDVSNEYQITLMYRLLGDITHSAVPVVFSRGNHESWGSMLPEFHEYAGANGDNFYYTVQFDKTLFIVLDAVTDKKDDDFIVRPMVSFDEYRANQLQWLKTVKGKADYQDGEIERVIAVCHIPYPLYSTKVHTDFMNALIAETERIGVDLLISGHRHKTYFCEAYGEENPASYPYIVGGKRSDSLAVDETIFASQFTGTALEIGEHGITAKFVNSKGVVLQEYTL